MLSKKKLGIINSSSLDYSYGGVAPFIKNLDAGLKENFELTYITLPAWLHSIEWFPRRFLYLAWLFFQRRQIRSQDFILSHTPEGSFVVSLCSTPYAHIFHGNFNPMSQSRYWYGKFFIGIFQRIETRILRTSKLMYTVGTERANVPKILNPIRHSVTVKPVTQRNGFIFAGRLEIIKNVDRIIQIYSKLPDHIRDINKLYIAGDGTQRESLKKLAVSLNIENQVVFLGSLSNDDLVATDSTKKLLLMASSQEGLPMAIAEALSVGVPVVSTDVGDISRVLKNNYNGGILPLSFTDDEYVHTILSILDDYETFSKNALESASVFRAEKISSSLSDDIHKILSCI